MILYDIAIVTLDYLCHIYCMTDGFLVRFMEADFYFFHLDVTGSTSCWDRSVVRNQ